MTKIKLGVQPKTVSHDLSFPMLDGTIGEVKLEYVYRNRKAFAEFIDTHIAAIRAEADAAIEKAKAEAKAEADAAKSAAKDGADVGVTAPRVSEAEITAKQIESHVNFIMGAVSGWNLDIPFDRESVEELVTTLPQAAGAIIQSYRTAMTEGRLGN